MKINEQNTKSSSGSIRPDSLRFGTLVHLRGESFEVWNINEDGSMTLLRESNVKPRFLRAMPWEVES